jgi:hypothetical protein
MLDQTQIKDAYKGYASEAFKTGYDHGFLNAIFQFYVYFKCDKSYRQFYILGFEHGVNDRISQMEKQEVLEL